jgi:hypothetical protein
MTESTPASKTRTVKIKSMGGKFSTGGFFVADGVKIGPEDVCTVPADAAKAFDGSEYVEFTNKTANCSLEKEGAKWVLLRE